MKNIKNIKEQYLKKLVKCSCGKEFTIQSFYPKDTLEIEICSNCHSFYTGEKNKILDTEGRVEAFNRRFLKK